MITLSLLTLFFGKISLKEEHEAIVCAICLASDLNIIARILF